MPQQGDNAVLTSFAYLAGFIDIVNMAVLSLQCAVSWLEDTGEVSVMTDDLYEIYLNNVRHAASFTFPHNSTRVEKIFREYQEGIADGLELMEQLVLHVFPLGETFGKDYVARLVRWVGMGPLDSDECAGLTIGQPVYYVSGRGEARVEALARVYGNTKGEVSVIIMRILYAGSDTPSIGPGMVINKVEEGTLYMRVMNYPLFMPHYTNLF